VEAALQHVRIFVIIQNDLPRLVLLLFINYYIYFIFLLHIHYFVCGR
jgi:hypothetical protein